jgi:hypothetical protein
LVDRANALLVEWKLYKDIIFHISGSSINEAVDCRLELDLLNEMAEKIKFSSLNNTTDIAILDAFDDSLTQFKEKMAYKILKNGLIC